MLNRDQHCANVSMATRFSALAIPSAVSRHSNAFFPYISRLVIEELSKILNMRLCAQHAGTQ